MRIGSSIAFIFALGAQGVLGQVPTKDVSPTGGIREFFDVDAKVAGSSLVGLELGIPPEKFDPADVRVAWPGEGDVLCIHSVSRDGLYTARSVYELPSNDGTGRALRLMPFSERYDTRLRDFTGDAIAVTAFSAVRDDCYDPDPVLLPVIHPGTETQLRILVNAGELLASISMVGTQPVPCEQFTGNVLRIAFDTLCRLDVALAPHSEERRYVLSLDDGLGISNEEFRVLIPGVR